MKKFKYLKISNTKKLRYIDNYFRKKLYIIFLPGFMSDMEGEKPQTLFKFAKKNKLGFLSLEYSGHGKSSGVFTKGNISIWSNDTKKVINKIVKKNNFILIGSSMGAWISMNLFKDYKKQIKGFLGIGAAPEFLTRLMWNKFSNKIKQEIKQKGFANIETGGYKYPISSQLIKDGMQNKVLSKKLNLKIPVTMIHGQKDEVVPVLFSKKVLSSFNKAKKKLVVIKNGDHSYINNRKYIDPLSLNEPYRSKPLIVAVRGVTFTYGLELMLSSDIALAEKNTRFAMLEVNRGLLMTGGATIRFVQRSGWGNAMKYLLTGLEFNSKEAYRMNLIQEVLEEDQLFPRAVELANIICNSSPRAIKEVIKNSRLAQVSQQKAIKQFDKIIDFFYLIK